MKRAELLELAAAVLSRAELGAEVTVDHLQNIELGPNQVTITYLEASTKHVVTRQIMVAR